MGGVITLSIEVELGWGVHDLGDFSHLSADGSAEREFLSRLLDHCADLGLPISFDIVGHLIHADCDGDHDGPHADDWFEEDPGTDAATDPLFYGPDIAREIDEQPVDHELCTHTYSHVPCRTVPPETVVWELEKAQSQLRKLTGSETKSIVPPRHSRPPTEALREGDIGIMRMSRDTSDRSRPSRLYELLFGPHPLFEPLIVDGVVETYCTSYPSLTSSALPAGQREPMLPFRAMPVRTRQRFQRRYLDRSVEAAAEADGYCHLWCHLYDLSNEYQWPVVESFLTELAAKRARGDVVVETMDGLHDRVTADVQQVAADD